MCTVSLAPSIARSKGGKKPSPFCSSSTLLPGSSSPWVAPAIDGSASRSVSILVKVRCTLRPRCADQSSKSSTQISPIRDRKIQVSISTVSPSWRNFLSSLIARRGPLEGGDDRPMVRGPGPKDGGARDREARIGVDIVEPAAEQGVGRLGRQPAKLR